jgi:tryptophan synthase alpha chain
MNQTAMSMANRQPLMTHIVAGYPTLPESKLLAQTMIESGVSYIEIQIPFSDPIADGKTIMDANKKALENGITPDDAFELMKDLSEKAQPKGVKLLFMSYYNILFKYGLEKFCKKAASIGCYGLIIPDITIDEEPHEHYLAICKKHNLHPIQVISPITPEKRLKGIAKHASGFVYCVATTGTTGARAEISQNLEGYIGKVRKHIPNIPLALGFGISSRSHVKQALAHADIAVIGSEIINIYNTSKKREALKAISELVSPTGIEPVSTP